MYMCMYVQVLSTKVLDAVHALATSEGHQEVCMHACVYVCMYVLDAVPALATSEGHQEVCMHACVYVCMFEMWYML